MNPKKINNEAENKKENDFSNLFKVTIAKSELLNAMLGYARKLKGLKTRFEIWVDTLKEARVDEYEGVDVDAVISNVFNNIQNYNTQIVFKTFKTNSDNRWGGQKFIISDVKLKEQQTQSLAGVTMGLDGLGSSTIEEMFTRRDKITRTEIELDRVKGELDKAEKEAKELREKCQKLIKANKDKQKKLDAGTPTTKAILNGLGSGMVGAFATVLPQLQGMLPMGSAMNEALGTITEDEQKQYESIKNAFGDNFDTFIEIADYFSENQAFMLDFYSKIQR